MLHLANQEAPLSQILLLQDMSWMEISYKTSKEHEQLINLAHDCFHFDTTIVRQNSWAPHISIAYDNPETPISKEFLTSLMAQYPTLQRQRRLKALSLWRTEGTIDQWECLESIPFPKGGRQHHRVGCSVDGMARGQNRHFRCSQQNTLR